MNNYEMLLRLGQALGQAPSQTFRSGSAIGIDEGLAALRDAEMQVIVRSQLPRKVLSLNSVSGTKEYLIGTSGALYQPVLDEQVSWVKLKDSSGNYGTNLTRSTIPELSDMGYDLHATTSGEPEFWYFTQDAYAESDLSGEQGIIGLYPAPTESVTNGIEVGYLPMPNNMPYMWGSNIQGETRTVTVSLGGSSLAFSSPVSSGIENGLAIGIVSAFGKHPRRWYAVSGAARTEANAANFEGGDYESGDWISVGITPSYTELSVGSGKLFVVASTSLIGQHYPAHADAVILLAARNIAEDLGDARADRLRARAEEAFQGLVASVFGTSGSGIA